MDSGWQFDHKEGQRHRERCFIRAALPVLPKSERRTTQRTSENLTKQSHKHSSTHNIGTSGALRIYGLPLSYSYLFSKKEKMFKGGLGSRGFLLWQLYACSFCRCISRLSQEALSFLLVLYPLPFCRGDFHDLDEVELLTKLTPKLLVQYCQIYYCDCV
jgi:hypothetical protein